MPVFWQPAASLAQRQEDLSVLGWLHQVLWVLREVSQLLLSSLVRHSARVGLGPLRFEPHASPVFWEVDVDEQVSEVVAVVVEMHQECAIIISDVELLIVGQALDVLCDLVDVSRLLRTALAPGASPFRLAPGIS